MRSVPQLAVLLVALACGPALASTHSSTSGSSEQRKKPAAKKKASTKVAPAKAPELHGMHATPYDCDLGDKVTIFRKPDDDGEIALQWKRSTHELTRMQTTTGADRFENAAAGWVWIGIPAKGMLLDSKKGRQLANECRSEEQKKMMVTK